MPDIARIKERFENAGQGHVFRFWDALSAEQRDQLIAEAAEIDLDEVARLVEIHVKGGGSGEGVDLEGLAPAPFVARAEHGGDEAAWLRARETGEAALAEGRVAAFVVAGGQGTRLGYDGPKGTFPATPVRQASLFQVFAEKIRAAAARYGKPIPWFIMTSHANHQATVDFFAQHGSFGLDPDHVRFFTQGRMPAVDTEGRILLASPHSIALSPDGHGGSLRALVRSGATATMRDMGIDTISYFQVDNPLIQIIDPAFIGFHIRTGSDMSSKMIPKAYPEEKLGHFCVQGERTVVIEYSDMPIAMQQERDTDGELRYRAGSIAIHILKRQFIEKLGEGATDYQLPFHRANKKIPTVDNAGNPVAPDKPNGVKFEMFVFDALPYARNPVVIETSRAEDFSPIKNAEGVDSPESCRKDQLRLWTAWAKAAGVEIETDDTGLPPFEWEVSPLFADSQHTFVEQWNSLTDKPSIQNGTVLG